MTAVRSRVNAKVTSSLQRSTVRIEVHVTELPQGASSYIKAEDAGIDATISVNDIHEAGVILVEDILSQLRDRAHQGAVHKPRTSRVQTCDPPNLLWSLFSESSGGFALLVERWLKVWERS